MPRQMRLDLACSRPHPISQYLVREKEQSMYIADRDRLQIEQRSFQLNLSQVRGFDQRNAVLIGSLWVEIQKLNPHFGTRNAPLAHQPFYNAFRHGKPPEPHPARLIPDG